MSEAEEKPGAGAGAKADSKPPDFKVDPTGVYEYLQKAYEELIGSLDKVKKQNRALHSMVAGHSIKTKKNSRSKQVKQSSAWLQVKRKAPLGFRHIMAPRVGTVPKSKSRAWRNFNTIDAADLALFDIAAKWKATQMEANTEVFQDFKLFKAALVKRFAIRQSSVESIKLVMELKQNRVFNMINVFWA